MAGGFLVQNVKIEGFKAFTSEQEINLSGRHVFLLGQNGNGKSSIIEAIRWGLFGSTGRPNEIVANRGYAGACRVEVILERSGKLWSLRRTLIRGASGGSDAVLLDDQGEEHLIRDIMPQLNSVNAGEGTHIIFAPQATPLRRQPEDLDAFERTVFNHLGLTHPRALLSQIQSFLTIQHDVEASLAKRLEEIRNNIEEGIAHLERQRGIILRSPPWDGPQPPSAAESENKAQLLIREVNEEQKSQPHLAHSLDALLQVAEEAIVTRQDRDLEGLGKELTETNQRRARLIAIRKLQESYDCQKVAVEDKQRELDTLLDGMSTVKLQSKVQEIHSEMQTRELRRRIVKEATLFLQHQQADSLSCPVCDAFHARSDLQSTLNRLAGQPLQDENLELSKWETKLKSAKLLGREVQSQKEALSKLTQELRDAKLTDTEWLSEQSNPENLNAMIDLCSERAESVEEQIDSREAWHKRIDARLSRLREEGKFHSIRRNLQDLSQSKNHFAQIEMAFRDLVRFDESVRTVCQSVEDCLNEQLWNEIPTVSEGLSKYFAALTQHSWFDQLVIARETLPKLELRVVSSQDPLLSQHPTGVLNGQAESALALVPYFAFSQAEEAPTEVFLVLLDDPTRAFDEKHTEILVERLAELGQNVQLIVASQESKRFLSFLPENFDSTSYVVIEPANWSYDGGPELVINRG